MPLISLTNAALAIPALALMLVGSPSVADAQSGRDKLVLILPPEPAVIEDSAFAVALADEIRDRMDSKLRFKIRVIPKTTISESLEASGFTSDALLDANNARLLADFLQSDAYVFGRLTRGSGTPIVTLRLVDLKRSGLSGWVTVRGEPAVQPDRFARWIVDSLENQVDAARHARDCLERRDRQDYRGANDRADRAFRMYPNHPTAALCMADVFEASRQPLDSMIAMLERAVQGDSLNARSWERLARLYQQNGDTVRAVNAFENQLAAGPGNSTLRIAVAAMHYGLQNYERARDLVNEGLARNPVDLPTLQLKAKICLEGELWDCALEALSAEYDLDSTLFGDTVFYAQVFGAAQEISDIAAMLRWSEEAVSQVPSSIVFWRARAAALKEAGTGEAALEAYGRILALDSSDFASALAAAQILVEGVVIDTTVPLDTVRLARADSLLSHALSLDSSEAVSMNVAALYYTTGVKMAQAGAQRSKGNAITVQWLEAALEHDVQQRFTVNANFFLGLTYFFILVEFNPRVVESKSCELVEQQAEMVAKGKAALTLGESVSANTVSQLMPYYEQFEEQVPQLRTAFECS